MSSESATAVAEEPAQYLTLVSSDNRRFSLSKNACAQSAFLTNLQDDDNEDGKEEEEEDSKPSPHVEVQILRVPGDVLEKVVNFLEHYVQEPMNAIETPLSGKTLEATVTQEWYLDFLNSMEEDKDKFTLLHAANYMDIAPLLDLLCLWTAHKVDGKNAEEVCSQRMQTEDLFLSLLNNWCSIHRSDSCSIFRS